MSLVYTKISMRVLWFREIIDRNEVKIEKVPTEENIADPLTKPLSQKKHDSHVFSYGLKNKHNWM